MLTTPPLDRPNSAEWVLVWTLNSSSASMLGKMTTELSQVSLLSTPSSRKLLSRVRMPLAENDAEARQARLPAPSMFAPGIPRITPGRVRVNWTKSRPFSGRFLICVSLIVPLRSELSVCTSDTVPWMVTDSVVAPTSSFRSTRAFWSTLSCTLASDSFLKPVISAEMLYVPGGNDGATYSPSESLTTTRAMPVCVLVRVILTPATAAPLPSLTDPRIVPLTACAAACAGHSNARKQPRRGYMIRLERREWISQDITSSVGISLRSRVDS